MGSWTAYSLSCRFALAAARSLRFLDTQTGKGGQVLATDGAWMSEDLGEETVELAERMGARCGRI